MERLIALGTGNAIVTKCYNTCFALEDNGEYFLVDAGGGNGILRNLEKAGISLDQIHHIFVTHEHCDHLLGMVWLIRMIATVMKKEKYVGKLFIYCHQGLTETIRTMAQLTLQKKLTKLIGERIILVPVKDQDRKRILEWNITFFDIHSTKAKQFGFHLQLKNGKRLTCAGDEPYNEEKCCDLKESDWLLHEAFCLYSQADIFQPYEKHHSTVKEACQLAEKYGVKNLVLWHTEDKNLENRKRLYTQEGREYYSGNLYVPEDLEWIVL